MVKVNLFYYLAKNSYQNTCILILNRIPLIYQKQIIMKTSKQPKVLAPLTIENASTVSTVINVNNPEWGSKKFNYKGQDLNDGAYTHTVGTGSNSSILSENEFRFWGVVSYN